MSLPGGIYVGLPVQYLPNAYDVTLYTDGQPGPVAAIITKIDSDNDEVFLIVFPNEKPPVFRRGIKYNPDAGDYENSFKLVTDADLTCGAEKTGYAVPDPDPAHFVITWDALAGTSFKIFYRVNGTTDWLTPNLPGNATAEYTETSATLAGLIDATDYDILLQHVCNNGIVSAGVVFTQVTVSPP